MEPPPDPEFIVVVSGPCFCGREMTPELPGVLIRRTAGPARFAAAPLCHGCIARAVATIFAWLEETN